MTIEDPIKSVIPRGYAIDGEVIASASDSTACITIALKKLPEPRRLTFTLIELGPDEPYRSDDDTATCNVHIEMWDRKEHKMRMWIGTFEGDVPTSTKDHLKRKDME